MEAELVFIWYGGGVPKTGQLEVLPPALAIDA